MKRNGQSLSERAAAARRWLAGYRTLRPAGRRLVALVLATAAAPTLGALAFGRTGALVAGVAAAAAASARLRWTFVDPLGAFAARINRSDPPDNPPLDEINRRDELGELSRALDACHQRLRRAGEESAGFALALADRVAAGADALEGDGDERAAALASLRALAGDLRTLGTPRKADARTDDPPVPLDALARRVADARRAVCDRRGVALRVDAVGDLAPARMHEEDARRVLECLVDGALAVSAAGQSVVVRIEPVGAFALVTVRDDGPSVPEFARADILGRHHRPEPGSATARRGAGLALAVARARVERAGGRLWITRGLRRGGVAAFTAPTTSGV